MKVVEGAKQLAAFAKIYLGFFKSLAYGRMCERFIPRLGTAARKSYVPAPRVALVLGALNEKELRLSCLAVSDEDRDGGLSCARLVDLDGRSRSQRVFETRDSRIIPKALQPPHTRCSPRCPAKNSTVMRVTESSAGVTSSSGCLPPKE